MLKEEEVLEASIQERLFLLDELQTLGFSDVVRLNEFNDNEELSYLVESVKDFLFGEREELDRVT